MTEAYQKSSLNARYFSLGLVVLAKAGRIEGHITVEGQPVAGQTVTAMSLAEFPSIDGMPSRPRFFAQRKTDSNGAFQIRDLPAGYAQVSCSLEARNRYVNVQIAPGQTTFADVEFPPLTATLKGRIYSQQVSPQDCDWVLLDVETPTGWESFRTEQNPDGTYLFGGVPAGTAVLSVPISATELVRLPEEVDIEDGATIMRDIDIASCVSRSCQEVTVRASW